MGATRLRTRWPAALLSVAVAFSAAVAVTLTEVHDVAAVDGLEIQADARFTIDPPTGVVVVENTFKITNTLSNTRRGNTVERPYFRSFSPPITRNNFAISVLQDGKRLDSFDVAEEDLNAVYTRVEIRFASELFAGETTSIVLRYVMVGGPPRDRENPTRINAAFAAFPAFAAGDPGESAVHVVVPGNWDIDQMTGNPDTAVAFGHKIATVDKIADPEQFTMWVIASNPNQLAETSASDTKGNRFEIRSWPNDPDWATFVKANVSRVPELEEMIGQSWPFDRPLRVLETATPSLRGYAGSFFPGLGLVQLGEDLDQLTLLHELSHAWFQDRWFGDRWVEEGLADTYASRLIGTGNGRIPPFPVSTSDDGYLALNDWQALSPVTDGTSPAEQFGYNASFLVIDTIVGEVGLAKMRDVFAAIAEGRPVYSARTAANPVPVRTGWRRLLDLLQTVGGSDQAEALFRDRVVSDDERGDLARRATARLGFADVTAAIGDWPVPDALSRAMEGWQFDDAITLIADAKRVLALRDQVLAKAASAGAELPGDLAEKFRLAVHASMPAVEEALTTFEVSLPG